MTTQFDGNSVDGGDDGHYVKMIQTEKGIKQRFSTTFHQKNREFLKLPR